ncbi:MAG: heavy metal translocating P-type ATPase, partial [Balneolaceae bacterium]
KTELFIRSFARIYTPAVVFLATLLVLLPALFVSPYHFEEWLYRGLVFLVISCPCALVISIPLGYFGGIGAASRNGILVKGSNFLDLLRSVETVVFDKTGTLTKGVFAVQSVEPAGSDREFLISLLHSVEKSSGHPIAKAILAYTGGYDRKELAVTGQREVSGRGIRADLDGREVAVGNRRLMEEAGVDLGELPEETGETEVCVSIGGVYAGRLLISDEIKEEAAEAIRQLRKLGVERVMMLSGDNRMEANRVGSVLKLDRVWPELLPGEKAARMEELLGDASGVTAYVGDGINDAPVLALSDVGISMGSMGSDVAIETADVVIQADNLTKVATSIRIGRRTRNIVWQNIVLAMGIKILVLGLGALGMATLWEAVFADVGVALLAILNAIRIQKMDFSR